MKRRPSPSKAWSSASARPSKSRGETPSFRHRVSLKVGVALIQAPSRKSSAYPVEGEDVGADGLEELRGREVIAHVREAESGRDAGGAGERAVERGLANAVAAPGREHARGPERLGIGVVDVRIVADRVTDKEIEPPGNLDRAGRAGRGLGRAGRDGRMVAVDVVGRAEKDAEVVHRSFHRRFAELGPCLRSAQWH
jgi:hypothetical protein